MLEVKPIVPALAEQITLKTRALSPMQFSRLLTLSLLLQLTACAGSGELAIDERTKTLNVDPTPAVFTPLFSNGMDGWTVTNGDNRDFMMVDGVLAIRGDRGWLASARQYSNFVLRGEFRFLEPSSDSGIFLRVEDGTDFIFGWPGDSYQVQVRDISENPGNNPLPLAQLYRHVVPDGETRYLGDLVADTYTGPGYWQQIEIRVLGRLLTVSLNGQVVTTAHELDNLAGRIGFQSERGMVEYRQMEIHEF